MNFASKSLESTALVSLQEKPEISQLQPALMTWEDVLAMPENTVEEMDLKLLALEEKQSSTQRKLGEAEQRLRELEKSEVRPLTPEEIEELREEGRICLNL